MPSSWRSCPPGRGTLVPEGADTLGDLSSWYRTALAPKIEAIRTAMGEHRTIRFAYHAPKGESEREGEPYYLVFRWSAWYVWAWCRDRGLPPVQAKPHDRSDAR